MTLPSVFLVLSLGISQVDNTPVVVPKSFDYEEQNPFDLNFDKESCILPREYGDEGSVTFLEDCPVRGHLSRFYILPMIMNPSTSSPLKTGVHPRVCCPEYLSPNAICTASDPWCPIYEELVYTDTADYDYVYDDSDQTNVNYAVNYDSVPANYDNYDSAVTNTEYEDTGLNPAPVLPVMAARSCQPYGAYQSLPGELEELGNLTECVTLDRCPELVDRPYAPVQTAVQYCGFEEEEQKLMICCPEDLVEEPSEYDVKPRFPVKGKARPVEDKSELCKKWAEAGGCALDIHFSISSFDPTMGHMGSREFFDFMQTTCLASCGWADKRGCVDEHPRCPGWAREGFCASAPFFMAHTCRESCGVCGFLSPFNTEEQVVDEVSYSEYKKENFKCGQYKLLCEINNETCSEEARIQQEITVNDVDLREIKDLTDADFEVFAFDATKPKDFYCGATIVTDRFIVAASHCYDVLDVTNDQTRVQLIRDKTPFKEQLEVKRIYNHPLYRYPNAYNDVSVIELGRRIEFDYKKFGDSPTCLDQGKKESVGRIGTVRGYGETENAETGILLEANVTVISNELCKEYLVSNSTRRKSTKKKIDAALKNGLNYGFLCAQGIFTENGIFTGACKGDSGGPLTVGSRFDPKDPDTLVGIVSGGVGCSIGTPGWYTRVSFYFPWIDCIIQASKDFRGNSVKVEEKCGKVARDLIPTCLAPDDLVFDVDLRSEDDDEKRDVPLCNTGDEQDEPDEQDIFSL